MTELMAFFLGGAITFILTGALIIKPMRDELTEKWQAERDRRIEAEDNGSHTQEQYPDYDWGDPMDFVAVPTEKIGTFLEVTDTAEVIDLTGVDDVPEG